MEMKIILSEKNVLEVDLGNADLSLGQLLVEKINANKDVEFAACKKEHPIIANPKIIIRTKKTDPKKILLEAISEVTEEMNKFKKEFTQMVK